VAFVETIVRRDALDVDRRLAELGVSRAVLVRAAAVAVHEGRNATPYHCANAAGTFSYHHGTWALRNETVGEDWAVDRSNGVEAIVNQKLKLKIVFSNVDIACDDVQKPKPRSPKGAGAERACIGNLFGDLPEYAPKPFGDQATFYLMVDENGASELTRPVVKGRTFSAYIERIYLGRGDGAPAGATLPLDADDAVNDFDPLVNRK
jgi:hypothetical protein